MTTVEARQCFSTLKHLQGLTALQIFSVEKQFVANAEFQQT